jgi:hypothetical protein
MANILFNQSEIQSEKNQISTERNIANMQDVNNKEYLQSINENKNSIFPDWDIFPPYEFINHRIKKQS